MTSLEEAVGSLPRHGGRGSRASAPELLGVRSLRYAGEGDEAGPQPEGPLRSHARQSVSSLGCLRVLRTKPISAYRPSNAIISPTIRCMLLAGPQLRYGVPVKLRWWNRSAGQDA